MSNEVINFTNGNLVIDSNSISFQQKRGFHNTVNTISRNNIGNVEIQNMRILEHVDFVYCYRTALIGIVIVIVGLVLFAVSKTLLFFYFGIGIIIFSAFMLFASLWIDGILGLNFAKNIFLSLYGVDAVRVVIQNKHGGNNLLFFVSLNEKNKLPIFEELAIEKVESVNVLNEKDSSLESITKLGELLNSGLITKEEFDLKKKQILGL